MSEKRNWIHWRWTRMRSVQLTYGFDSTGHSYCRLVRTVRFEALHVLRTAHSMSQLCCRVRTRPMDPIRVRWWQSKRIRLSNTLRMRLQADRVVFYSVFPFRENTSIRRCWRKRLPFWAIRTMASTNPSISSPWVCAIRTGTGSACNYLICMENEQSDDDFQHDHFGHLHFECSQIDHCESFGQTIAQNTFWIAATYLVSRQQKIETFKYVIYDRRWSCIEASLAQFRHENEKPNMHSNHTDELEQNFSNQIFPQIQRTIDDNKNELNQQCDQKCHRNFVFLQIRLDATIALGSLQFRNFELKTVSIEVDWSFALTPNDVNPNSSTKKLMKSHKKMYAYTSADTRLLSFNSLAKNAVNGEQYFVDLKGARKVSKTNGKMNWMKIFLSFEILALPRYSIPRNQHSLLTHSYNLRNDRNGWEIFCLRLVNGFGFIFTRGDHQIDIFVVHFGRMYGFCAFLFNSHCGFAVDASKIKLKLNHILNKQTSQLTRGFYRVNWPREWLCHHRIRSSKFPFVFARIWNWSGKITCKFLREDFFILPMKKYDEQKI